MPRKKIKKAVFNSGFLSVEQIKLGKREDILPKVPFGNETVTENRFNAAMASDARIVKVVHIPLHNEILQLIPENAIVQINKHDYEIWKQQPIETTNPPIVVLQLKEWEYGKN